MVYSTYGGEILGISWREPKQFNVHAELIALFAECYTYMTIWVLADVSVQRHVQKICIFLKFNIIGFYFLASAPA